MTSEQIAALYQAESKELFNYAFRQFHYRPEHEQDAYDIVGETFERLIKRVKAKPIADARIYLREIAKHLVYAALAKAEKSKPLRKQVEEPYEESHMDTIGDEEPKILTADERRFLEIIAGNTNEVACKKLKIDPRTMRRRKAKLRKSIMAKRLVSYLIFTKTRRKFYPGLLVTQTIIKRTEKRFAFMIEAA